MYRAYRTCRVIKRLVALIAFVASYGALFSFEWPQSQVSADAFYSYFGQLRGDVISNSLIFAESDTVKAVDNGRINCIIQEHEDANFFDSTLGNAVILCHEDAMLSVYGNLDAQQLPLELLDKSDVAIGEALGVSGNSGWQLGKSSLEFLVCDTRNRTSVNPRLLMPRIGQELPLQVTGLCVTNKNGKLLDIGANRTLQAGIYLLYRERQSPAVPFRTDVYVNGVIVEKLNYDTLRLFDNRMCICGKHNYPVEMLYPDDKRHLLGEINLMRGHNTITIVVTDILGIEKAVTYNVDCV